MGIDVMHTWVTFWILVGNWRLAVPRIKNAMPVAVRRVATLPMNGPPTLSGQCTTNFADVV